MNDQTLDPAIHIHELGSNARAAAKGPVSYTHLTLPTNREV